MLPIPWWIDWLSTNFWWIILGGSGAIMVLLSIQWVVRRPSSQVSTGYGSATFASYAQVKRAGLLTGEGIVIGQFGAEILRAPGEGHMMLIAPSRSGKDVSTVDTTAVTWSGSLICLDMKSETYAKTAAFRRQPLPDGLGQRVIRYNPSMPGSHRINLMDGIRAGTISEVADAERLASSIAEPDAPPDQRTAYWQHQDIDVLTMVLLYLCHQAPVIYPRSLPGAYRLMTDPRLPLPRALQLIGTCPHPKVQQRLQRFKTKSHGKQLDVWDGASGLLTVWDDPLVAAASIQSDFSIEEIQQGPRPISLYLQVSAEDLRGRLKRLFRVTIDQLFGRMMDRPTRVYQWPVALILNEFAQMGYLPSIESLASLVAGYGIRALFVLQSRHQLKAAYGEHTSLVANCPVRVVYAPNDEQEADEYSMMLGDTTVDETSQRVGGSRWVPWYQQQGTTTSRHARRLMTVGELQELGPDEGLVRVTSCPPIRFKKIWSFRDHRFAPRFG